MENDLGGVGRRAAVIALRFHVYISVDVTDDDAVRVFAPPLANLVHVGVRGQRTERAKIGSENALARFLQDRQDFIHEQHRRFDQNIGVRVRALLREVKRISHRIGDILNITRRVVVRQDVGVLLFLELGDLRQ